MDRGTILFKNAPHTAATLLAADWAHAYSREQAAYRCRRSSEQYWPPVGRATTPTATAICSVPACRWPSTRREGPGARRRGHRHDADWFLRAAATRSPSASGRKSRRRRRRRDGGQISVSHVEPWANPVRAQDPAMARAAGRAAAFRPRLDRHQWRWGLQFLIECLNGRTRRNMLQTLASAILGRCTARAAHRDRHRLRRAAARILQIYPDREDFDDRGTGGGAWSVIRHRGECEARPRSALALEPALAARRDWIVGGTYTATDETGDAHKFTQALAALAAERGVAFRFGATVESLAVAEGTVCGARMVNENNRKEVLAADAYVVCLSSHTPKLLDPIGVRALVYPAKGYSATWPSVDPAAAPTISITDDARKIVFTRLGNRLRVAGTAEISGYDLELNAVRCEALTKRAAEWFGAAIDPARAEYWTGLRPATPSNVPLIGRTRYPNLYLNTGHGTLGWTMAAGSGKALRRSSPDATRHRLRVSGKLSTTDCGGRLRTKV